MPLRYTHKEREAIKGALISATHKMAKLVQQSQLVSDTEFMEFAKKAYKGDYIMPTIEKIMYCYADYRGPEVKIYTQWPGLVKFRASFYMAEPTGKFEDRTPIPHDIKVEIFSHWDDYMEKEIWERI